MGIAEALPTNAMDVAKRLMSRAAEAVLRNDPRAVSLATAALAALQAATDGASNSDDQKSTHKERA